MRASLVSAALVAALVGYGASVAIVLAAATALGATPAQTASWLLAVCIGKAAVGALLSYWHRVPVVLAWSTPGAALIAATNGISMPEAVGAFLLAGVLIMATGLIKPLGQVVAMIPDGIAAAMLGGVLLPFCLKGAGAVQALPVLILPMVAVFAVIRLWNPAIAVLAALLTGVAVAFATGAAGVPFLALPVPSLTFIAPEFRVSVLIGLGLPLYLVTMAGQNLPGFTTMRAAGFAPPVQSALVLTGGISAAISLFGAHTFNMAAITAAICMGDDVHPDRAQRWRVGVAYGAVWVMLGLASPAVLMVLTALPAALITGIVALALLGPLMGALTTALAHAPQRFAATMTLVVTGSGVAAFGIGAAFWGLLAGLAIYAMERARA